MYSWSAISGSNDSFPSFACNANSKVMEAAVREGRGLNLNSEGACARFFRARLGKSYRSLYLGEQVKERTGGMSTVYDVTMPKTGKFFGKRKVSARDLEVARLTQYMYCVGDGPRSFLDLVKGVHGTTFPSKGGVWGIIDTERVRAKRKF